MGTESKCKMEVFVKIVNGIWLLTIFAKSMISDVFFQAFLLIFEQHGRFRFVRNSEILVKTPLKHSRAKFFIEYRFFFFLVHFWCWFFLAFVCIYNKWVFQIQTICLFFPFIFCHLWCTFALYIFIDWLSSYDYVKLNQFPCRMNADE